MPMNETRAYTAPIWGQSPYTWAGGWTVKRMRRAIESHDQGYFQDSYAASVKVTQWAQIFGALHQRIAPALRLPRAVEGATGGLDGLVRQEAEGLFCGNGNDLAPAFPSLGQTVWHRAMLGFAWWQTTFVPSADGSMVVPRTTIWPVEATYFNRGIKRWFAYTTEEGLVEIDPADPRWTLVADAELDEHGESRPWLDGAIRAVGEEYVEAVFTKDDRADYSDQHGRPKPIGILPPSVKVDSPEGKAALQVLQLIRESDAGGLFANGTTVTQLEASANAVQLFKDILDSNATAVAIAILGTDGTMSKGTGGVYSSPMFQGVAENRVASDVKAYQRASNRILSAWRARNYADARAPLTAVIRLPDTDRDARTKSLSERLLALHTILDKEKANGCEVTQERVNELAKQLDVPPPTLAIKNPPGAQSFAYDQDNGVITIGERRAELGKPPSDRDDMTIPQYRSAVATPPAAAPAPAPAEPAPAAPPKAP